MSETRFKYVIRARLEWLDGKTAEEVLDYFKEKIGEPKEFYSPSDYMYSSGKDVYTPVYDYDNKLWGVDIVLEDIESYGGEYLAISYHRAHLLCSKLQAHFNIINPSHISILSYTYDTSSEDPIDLSFEQRIE